MRIHHHAHSAAAALTLGLLLAGCSGLPGMPSQPPEPPPGSAPPRADPTASTPPSSAPSSEPPASADPSGSPSAPPTSAPAATRDGTIKGKKLRVTLYPVRRTDTLSVLDFTISWPKTSGTKSDDYLGLNAELGDNDAKTGDRNTFNVTDGVRLVDAESRKVYLAASDDSGACLCSQNLGSVLMRPGETYTLYTTFAAPPAGVTAVDVTVPGFGSVRGVPVT